LGSEYRDIAASIRTREKSFTFEELHSHLIAHEEFLQKDELSHDVAVPTAYIHQRGGHKNYRGRGSYRQGGRNGPTPPQNGYHNSSDSTNSMMPYSRQQSSPHNHAQHRPFHQGSGNYNSRSNCPPTRCQFCDFPGHIAKACPQLMQPPTANYAAANSPSNWILDTGASHHVASDLSNLSLHSDYEGPESVTIDDGSGLAIKHTGSTHLSTPSSYFTLNNVLCVPKASHNLISVSKFCQQNNVYVEFHPFSFSVKDLKTGATLMHGPSNGDLYSI
jgi:histone deacetylase 1/2